MREKNQRHASVFSLFLVFAFLINAFQPVRAQDVVTSEDFTGGSSAFVFRTSRKPTQRKIALRTSSNLTRTKSAKLESIRRISKQSTTVAKVNPKRTKSKEVPPEAVKIDSVEFKRKTPQETSVIFAGVGEYHLNRDEVDKSVEWFREATLLDEKNNNAKNGLSDALTRKGNNLLTDEKYELAKLVFEEALRHNPKNAGAHAGLAIIFTSKDEIDNAIASYERALATDAELTELNAPLGVLYYQKGEIAKAEIYLQKAIAASPDNAETQKYFGILRFKQDRDQEALTALQRSVELDPNDSDAHYYLGSVLDRLNRDSEAIAAYQKSLQLNPNFADAWFDLGVAYFNRDRLNEAIEAYKQAIKLNQRYGEAHANLADVYRLTGKWDEAISSYRLATTFITNDAELYSKFGYVATRRAATPGYRSYWKMAIENFEKAAAIAPHYIDYTNLGWAYYNVAQSNLRERNEADYKLNLGKARDAFVKANTLNPVPKVAAAINLNLGMTLTDLGDYPGAIVALKKATEMQRDWIAANHELGLAYRKNGDLENAVRQFKRVIDLDDKFAAAYYSLAEAEFRRNNLKEAKKYYEKLKTMSRPDLVRTLELATNGGILQ
jgi:tetratricopeptide (TPR) repeat protein